MVRAKGAEPSLCRRILQEAAQYQRLLKLEGGRLHNQESGTLLAHAYPDRIAMKKQGSSQHILASGRGVLLPQGDHLQKAKFLVAANVDGGKKQGRIFLAAALSLEDLNREHASLMHREELVVWHKTKVEAASILRLGSLELGREALTKVDPETMRRCLLQGIRENGMNCLGWQKKSRELQAKMASAHAWAPDTWPEISDTTLLEDLSWLEPYLAGISSLKQLKKLDLKAILLSRLSWQDQQKLEHLLPSHCQVPSGSRIRLTYQGGEPPILAVRLQEMFGATSTPTVFGGTVAVVVHLLSPAGRPIQVTRDLAGFWQNTYHEVKKELKGRYPKHYWPDDPLSATATNRVKPRKKS